MWKHLIDAAAQPSQNTSGDGPQTILGVVASGFFGVAIVVVDRILSKRRPRSDRVMREQEHIDAQYHDLYDRLLSQLNAAQAELTVLRNENANLRAEVISLRGEVADLRTEVNGYRRPRPPA